MKILGFELKLPKFLRPDRRKAQRARIFEDLYVDYKSLNPSRKGTGEGRDISVLSLNFFSDDKLPAGTSLELRLRLSPGVLQVDQIFTRATVVRCSKGFREKQYRVACNFEGIDQTTRSQIETFVAWLKQREQKYLFFRYNSKDNSL